MSKLHIKQVKNKQSHKAFKVSIDEGEHLYDLCKFLKKYKDRRLDIVINDKKVSFNSVASRKKFADGFEIASDIIGEQVKKFADETFAKINSLTSQLSDVKEKLKEERHKFSTKHTVLNLRKVAWEDRVAELEEACELYMKENKRLMEENEKLKK